MYMQVKICSVFLCIGTFKKLWWGGLYMMIAKDDIVNKGNAYGYGASMVKRGGW